MKELATNYVLLIEDDPWLAESYAALFAEGINVELAKDAQEAIQKCDESPPRLIIADVVLEHGLVIDLLHELQSHADTAATPVVLCSSIASEFDSEEMKSYGVVKIFDKATVTPEQLRDIVQEYA